jgi:hypothetical protein
VVSKELLSQRTSDYQNWVEAFARNHKVPIQWAEKGVRKEVQPWLRRMVRKDVYGVYFIFKSMEQGPTFRVAVPKYPTKDPNHRILAGQRSRFTHDYFYIRDEVLGPIVMRVATFFPFQATLAATLLASGLTPSWNGLAPNRAGVIGKKQLLVMAITSRAEWPW